MPIICFEGASAVGKTTTANALESDYGALAVPEVNQLFDRPDSEPADWYFERQVERWSMAREQSKFHSLVILDGDPFQPLWYCWAYDFDGWQSLDFMERFYKPKIRNKIIGFPDLYFIFSTTEDKLRKRRQNDVTRKRRGFEAHLRMIEPQRRYFETMRLFSPHRVSFLRAETIETNIEFIQRSISGVIKNNETKSEELFDKMTGWLRKTKA